MAVKSMLQYECSACGAQELKERGLTETFNKSVEICYPNNWTSFGIDYDGVHRFKHVDLCPTCTVLYRDWIRKFFNYGVEFENICETGELTETCTDGGE